MNTTTSNNWIKNIRNFFWWSAGVDSSLLTKCPLSVQLKYTAIGVLMIFIAVLACLSFSYFLTLTFKISPIFGFLGGAFWSSLVFSLERVVLSSFRKGETSLLSIVLRFLLILSTGFIIGDLIALKIFEKEVNLELLNKGRAAVTQAKAEVTTRFQTEITNLETEKTEIQNRLKSLETDLNQKRNAVTEEVEGKSRTGKGGYGIAAKQKDSAFADANQKYNDYKTESAESLGQINTRLGEIQQEIEAQTYLADQTFQAADGTLARHAALIDIVTGSVGAALKYFPIFLILILIEILPFSLKVFSQKKDGYEELLETEENTQVAEIKARNTFETESLERSRSLLKAQADKFLQIIINDNIESLNDVNDIRVCNTLKAEALRRIEDEVFQREAKLLEDADFADVITVEVIGRADMNIRLQVPKNAQKTLSLKTIGGDIQSIADSIGGKLQLAKALSSANREISANLPLLTQLEKDFKMLLLFEPLGET